MEGHTFWKPKERAGVLKYEFVWLPLLFAVGGTAVAGCFSQWAWRIFIKNRCSFFQRCRRSGLVFGLFVAVHHRFMRTGPLERSAESL